MPGLGTTAFQPLTKRTLMKQKIINYIRAGYSGVYIVSPEENRVEAEIKNIAQEIGFNLHFWSIVDGLVEANNGHTVAANDPMELLQAIGELKERTLVLLKDFHLFLADPNPILVSKLKSVLQYAKTVSITLVVLGCRLTMPPELERELTVVEFALPGKEQLSQVLDGIIESAKLKSMAAEDREKILDSAAGLTTLEAENTFALSVVQQGKVDPVIVAREKALAVKKNGLLEIIEAKESLASIGGLNVLKDWLVKRKNAFSEKAKHYGLPSPKGLLIAGLAGTGKSLAAKAVAKVFGIPLLKLDAGKIYSGLVGASEANLRSVMQTAEAIAPCCVWLDELDKGFAGSKSSGSTDGGTSARVLGSFLSWMQEKKAPVFVVATANDVAQLPAELLRKGRFDELFFVDLPNQEERKSIWAIQIQKHGRDPKDYDLAQLAKATDGYTGSEIESAFVDSLYQAFDEDAEPSDLTIAKAITELVPLSKLMAEQITALRNWSKGRARRATSQPMESNLRKLAT